MRCRLWRGISRINLGGIKVCDRLMDLYERVWLDGRVGMLVLLVGIYGSTWMEEREDGKVMHVRIAMCNRRAY